jgi:CBS domain-containing protein
LPEVSEMFTFRTVVDCATKALCMGRNQTLEEAKKSMKSHDAPCVVVVHRGRAVGVVTRRELTLIDTVSDAPFEALTLKDVMLSSPFEVAATMPVRDVIEKMVAEELPVAVVTDHAAVRGVFTAMDAVRVLAEALAERGRRRTRVIAASHPRLTAVG